MNRKIFNYFEIAGRMATSKDDLRSFLLGSVGIRRDGKVVKSFNSCSVFPERRVHSEYRLAQKLDYGATVYVARIRLIDKNFGISRPCFNCRKILTTKRVEKVYYTINKNQYGVWYVDKDFDRVFNF